MRKLYVVGIDLVRSMLPQKQLYPIRRINIDWNIAKIFDKGRKCLK